MVLAYIPTIKYSSLSYPKSKARLQGKGASVLLQKGGSGGGSSFSGIDDYVATTGRNPYAPIGSGLPSVQQVKKFSQQEVNEAKPSLEKFGKKLESLTLKVPKPNKIKNIRFNL